MLSGNDKLNSNSCCNVQHVFTILPLDANLNQKVKDFNSVH